MSCTNKGGGLSGAERDMDMIFCLAIAKTFTFGSPEMCNLLDEYKALMKNKEKELKKIKAHITLSSDTEGAGKMKLDI